MGLSENKKLTERYFEELLNKGNLDVAAEILASNFVFENPPNRVEGADAFNQMIMGLRSAFPDMRFFIEDEIAEGNKVVTRWRYTGTQHGAFLGNPPTQKRFDVTGIDIFQIEGQKVQRIWVNMDLLGQAQQLGWIPSPPQSR
jgi:steroid delta-isomerase-like uncharacterized protein